MFKFSKVASVVCGFLLLLVFQAQGDNGGMDAGGGDIVKCNGTKEEQLNGHYALDYALMIGRGGAKHELNPNVKDWDEYESYLLEILDEKSAKLKTSFKDFAKSTQQIRFCGFLPCDTTIASKRHHRIWNGAQLKLENLPDEGNLLRLPKECKKQLSSTQPGWRVAVKQAIVRHQFGPRITYNYDGVLKFVKHAPYQFSFLLVHEWLRDFTQDPEVIRNITWFLHSNEVLDLNADEFNNRLKSLGLIY